MANLMTNRRLREENQRYRGTGGVSEYNRGYGFLPAFHDLETGRTVLSRYPNGSPAPIHLISALPEDWVEKRDRNGDTVSAKQSVIAGFIYDGRFYTREQAALALVT